MKRTKAQRGGRRDRLKGQSMVEYLLLAAIAVALLAVPIQGNHSVVEMMLSAIRTGYDNFLAALSLPQ